MNYTIVFCWIWWVSLLVCRNKTVPVQLQNLVEVSTDLRWGSGLYLHWSLWRSADVIQWTFMIRRVRTCCLTRHLAYTPSLWAQRTSHWAVSHILHKGGQVEQYITYFLKTPFITCSKCWITFECCPMTTLIKWLTNNTHVAYETMVLLCLMKCQKVCFCSADQSILLSSGLKVQYESVWYQSGFKPCPVFETTVNIPITSETFLLCTEAVGRCVFVSRCRRTTQSRICTDDDTDERCNGNWSER